MIKDAMDLLKKAWYTIPLILLSLLSFGFGLCHTSVGVDDLVIPEYVAGGMLGKGRYGTQLVMTLFQVKDFSPFTLQLIALILLFCGTTVFCVLFQRVSQKRLQPMALLGFAGLFMTFPILAESWTMDGHAIVVSAGYLMTAGALTLMYRYLQQRKWYTLLGGTICILLFITTYETFVGVYICGVFAILILRWLYGEEKDKTLKTVLLNGLQYAAPLILCAIVRILTMPHYAMNTSPDWNMVLRRLFVRYILYAKWYLPIRVLVCGYVAAAVLAVTLGRRQNKSIWLLFFGLVLSVFSVDLAMGTVSLFIAQQTAALFVGIIGMLALQFILDKVQIRWIRRGVSALMILLCFYQALDMNRWIQLDHRRYEEERATMTSVVNRLEETCDLEKPVVFIGLYRLGDEILDQCTVYRDRDSLCNFALDVLDSQEDSLTFVTTACYPLLQWGLEAFEPGQQILRFCRYHGMNTLHGGTAEQYRAGNRIGAEMPVWPARDSVLETEDCIIVKLGEIWISPVQGE